MGIRGGSMDIGIRCRSRESDSNALNLVHPPSCSGNGSKGVQGMEQGDDASGEMACHIFLANS